MAQPSREGAGESPNVVLIAFSGRCARSSCTPPDENEDALARALVPAAVAAWSAAGHRVEAWTYRAHVDDDPQRGRGSRSARADLSKAVLDGVLGPDAGTGLVLLGYAHGTQFAHLLAFEHPGVPFTASVLLDSICLGWDADHAVGLVAALAPGAGPWGPDGPYGVGCDVLSVPGLVVHLDLGDAGLGGPRFRVSERGQLKCDKTTYQTCRTVRLARTTRNDAALRRHPETP